nr:flippase [Herpetosiphonaceae bacterium]
MSEWGKHATRSTFLGLLAEILARTANTIFFFIIAHKAGEAEAGTYALGFAFAMILTQCALGGLDQFMLREVAYRPQDTGQIVGECLSIRLVSACLTYSMFIVWLAHSNNLPHAQTILRLLGATVVSESLGALYQSYLVSQHRVEFTVLISGLSGLLKLGGILLVLVIGGDAIAAALMVLIANVGALGGYMYVTARYLPSAPWRFTVRFWRSHWLAVMPFFFAALLGMVEGSVDTLLLAHNFGTRGVGVYNAAASLMAGLLIFPRVVRQVTLPIVTRYYAQFGVKVRVMLEQMLRVIGGGSVLISVTLICCADQVMTFLARSTFPGAALVLQVLAASFIVLLVSIPNGRLLAAAGQQKIFVPIQIASTLSTLVLNLLLQPMFGVVGAAWADLASALLVFGLGALYVHLRIVRWPLLPTLGRLTFAALPFIGSLV